MANIPTQHQQTFPLSLLTVLLHAKKPMASRMKGRRKGIHCHSREDTKIVSIHSLSATQDCHTTVIINLTATIPLLRSYKPSTALCDLHLASYAPNHPKGRLLVLKPRQADTPLKSLTGTWRLKGPIFIRTFREILLYYKTVTVFLQSQKFPGLLAGSQTMSVFFNRTVFIPLICHL